MSVPLRIVNRQVGDVVVLQLHGHLVADESDRALREYVHALALEGRIAVLLDLEDVSYIDSGGIGGLVQLYNELTARGGHLKLVHPSRCSTRVLQITHLSSVFEIYETEDEALRSMPHAVR